MAFEITAPVSKNILRPLEHGLKIIEMYKIVCQSGFDGIGSAIGIEKPHSIALQTYKWVEFRKTIMAYYGPGKLLK